MFENSKWVYQLKLQVFDENRIQNKTLLKMGGMSDKWAEDFLNKERKALVKKIKSLPDSDAEPYGA